MDTIEISCIVFGFILGGVMLGAVTRPFLSEQHLNADAKDVVKTATAFMATLSALVLGLLIATAKSSFDTKNIQVRQLTANVILLDQLLNQYGPTALNARQIARRDIAVLVERIWHEHNSNLATSNSFTANPEAEEFFQDLYALSPQNDMQRALKGRIVRVATVLAQERLSLFVQSDNTISTPFLVILTFWLTMIFAILSLLTRLNLLIAIILLICALSVSASVFLILDLDRAFSGMIQVSSAPLRNALPPNIR
jgi:hypothetical protein